MTGPTAAPPRHLVVVGGGITGLAAAWEASAHADVAVTLLEADTRWGGKILTSDLPLDGGPTPVDEAADMFLARVPDAVGLCRELGLEDRLTQPAAGRAKVWWDGALHWFPAESVLGVPLDDDDLAATGVLSPDGLAAVRDERDRSDPPPAGDVAIGPWLADRFGPELVDRIVGTLVGGINAGDVGELSLRAVTPQLAEAAADGGSLTGALRRRRTAEAPTGPAFRALLGGTGQLVATLVDALRGRGVELRPGTAVTHMVRGDDRVTLRLDGGDELAADAVVVATPAHASTELLRPLSSEAAEELAGIGFASATLVTLVYERSDVPVELDATGFLVPRDAGLLLAAVSWSSVKWAHWDDGRHVVLRASAGHRHDDRGTTLSDAELVDGLRADLTTTMGITAEPSVVRISRWPQGFAQYTVGHLDRCDRIDAALRRDAPTVRVAGASLRGLGIPACIRQGRAAAGKLLATDPA